ncbi:sensor histidine kinase [Streptomyces sp. NPDC127098]|uniref:sensor histidine kinase n=1 Tax=Streptomyces sp. NPDC127098 TaxID=3347137 RepID=UPI00364D8D44
MSSQLRAPEPVVPLPQRLPPAARAALPWGAAAGLGLLLAATTGAPLVAVPLAAPLVLAWRRPLPVLAVVLVEVAVAAALGVRAEGIWPLFVVAGLLVGRVAASRPRPGAAAVTLAVLETVLQLDLVRDGGTDRALAVGFLGLSGCLALAVLLSWLAGTTVRQRREYAAALQAQAAVAAVTAERLRIARELHDMVAHNVGAIAIQAGAGSRVLDRSPGQARGALDSIEATSRETLRELRCMLDLLRQPEDDPLTGLGDVDRLVATTAGAGVHAEVRRLGERRPLPPTVDHAAFRIVQESLTNVVRHAGTDRCRVTIHWLADELSVEVDDDGVGGTGGTGGTGYGIAGMRERAELLGGRLTAGPRPDGGFRVAARIPLERRSVIDAPGTLP